MATYRNLAELGNNILKLEDIVILKGLEYKVRSFFLGLSGGLYPNNKIFDDLNINIKEFCSKHYGYPDYDYTGGWPEYKNNDYEAATRVVKALFEIIESENKSKEFNPKKGDLVYLKPLKELEDAKILMSESLKHYCGSNLVVHSVGFASVSVYTPDKSNWFFVDKRAIEPAKTIPNIEFKVGDTVKVKSYEYAESIGKTAGLKPRYFGNIHKIEKITEGEPANLLDNNFWYYSEVLEPYTEPMKEEPKFKVGDTVRVKSLDWYNANKDEYGNVVFKEGAAFIASMAQYCNKITTIKEIDHDGDYILEDCDIYCFSPEAIEKVEDIPVTAPIQKYDNISPNKVECSSEFKFTVNKPKKVFF